MIRASEDIQRDGYFYFLCICGYDAFSAAMFFHRAREPMRACEGIQRDGSFLHFVYFPAAVFSTTRAETFSSVVDFYLLARLL